MKTTLAIMIALLAAGASAAGELVTEADFEEFAGTGVIDSDMTNATALEMVTRGISDDQPPRIAELTVQALGNQAFEVALYQAVVQRPFHLVPGLKEFLVGYWHDNIDGFAGGAGAVPMILAVHYPGDEDAHRVIWEYHANGGPDFATLLALNAGRFKTPEADRLRIDSLSSEDFVTFAGGALGLATSKPRGGVEALVSALKSNPLSPRMPATDKAIRAYGPEALPALREALDGGDLSGEAADVVSKGIREIENDSGGEVRHVR